MVKSALLLRAIEDVKRIWRIRDDKSALTSLHQRGLLGDDTKSRFEFAEKELEAEILDVVQEANSFKQGWGTLIFATATEMAQAERTRETVLNIPKIRMREGEFLQHFSYILLTLLHITLATQSLSLPFFSSLQNTSTPKRAADSQKNA
jgi:translocation protein SEC66